MFLKNPCKISGFSTNSGTELGESGAFGKTLAKLRDIPLIPGQKLGESGTFGKILAKLREIPLIPGQKLGNFAHLEKPWQNFGIFP